MWQTLCVNSDSTPWWPQAGDNKISAREGEANQPVGVSKLCRCRCFGDPVRGVYVRPDPHQNCFEEFVEKLPPNFSPSLSSVIIYL